MIAVTCLHFAVCPPWDLNHHVEHCLFCVSIQGNIMERRYIAARTTCITDVSVSIYVTMPDKMGPDEEKSQFRFFAS